MAYEFERVKDYIGDSTEDKSPGRPGEKFYESDTGKIWVWDGIEWVEDLTLIYALDQVLNN